MATTARARLKIHDLGDGGLILIHEVDQPSYMILWDIEIPDFIYCSIATGEPLQSGLVDSSSPTRFAPCGCQALLASGFGARTETGMAFVGSSPVIGSVTGGHC